jgi:hypothetical protein
VQSPCAHHAPHYTVPALCSRKKRAVALHHFGLRSIVAGWTWCASTRGGRSVRYARMIVNAHHVSQACMQSFCAHHAPHYSAQTLCAREKRTVALPQAFRLRFIVAGWTWCATSMASAAAARTATTTMHSPTHRRLRQAHTATTTMHSTTALHTAGVAAACATLAPSKRLRRNPLL